MFDTRPLFYYAYLYKTLQFLVSMQGFQNHRVSELGSKPSKPSKPFRVSNSRYPDRQDLTDASGRGAAADILATLLRAPETFCGASAGGGDVRWQEALAELTGKVYGSPIELTGALLAAIQELYEAAGLEDDTHDGAILATSYISILIRVVL